MERPNNYAKHHHQTRRPTRTALGAPGSNVPPRLPPSPLLLLNSKPCTKTFRTSASCTGKRRKCLKSCNAPKERRPGLRRLLFHAQTLSNLRAISENPSVQHNAGRAVNAKFLAAEGIFQELEIAAEKSFDAQIAELGTAEREFFAGFGLPHETTAVTRIATEEKAKIRAPHYRKTKEMLLNSPGGGVLAMLNVSGLSELFQ